MTAVFELVLSIVALVGYGALLGWWAGCRFQRARDAARYLHHARRQNIRSAHLLTLAAEAIKTAHALIGAKDQAITVNVDFAFVVEALQRSGYDVTPRLMPEQKH